MRVDLKVFEVEKIDELGYHHEYRDGPLPAYVVSYDSSENIGLILQQIMEPLKHYGIEIGDGSTSCG